MNQHRTKFVRLSDGTIWYVEEDHNGWYTSVTHSDLLTGHFPSRAKLRIAAEELNVKIKAGRVRGRSTPVPSLGQFLQQAVSGRG